MGIGHIIPLLADKLLVIVSGWERERQFSLSIVPTTSTVFQNILDKSWRINKAHTQTWVVGKGVYLGRVGFGGDKRANFKKRGI